MTESTTPPRVRLNKFIAQHLSIGRRQADFLIERGRVKVDGETPDLGMQIDPTQQQVSVDGKPIQAESHAFIYLALHKPAGYICSRRQQGDAPTIFALLPPEYHHLKPVGRLDKDSSGIILLTNDGDFAHRMTHPSFHKTKQYQVILDQPLQPLHRQLINDHGIDLPDGKSKLQLERLNEGDDHAWVVAMHEGRNRQIRRTFQALGYTVIKLHRTHFGTYQLGTLPLGKFEPITK